MRGRIRNGCRALLALTVLAALSACAGEETTSFAQEPETSCSVLPVLTQEQIEATIRVDISGAGTCGDGFAGTLTVRNSSGGSCASDIMADLAPAGERLWFASTSGAGGATGRWEPLPDDVAEGVGIMEYPAGVRSWPIELPPLDPGRYRLTLASGITCATSARFEATFEVTAAKDSLSSAEACGATDSQSSLWTRNGCEVSADVLLDRSGPAQCGFDSARVIVIGWPIGASYLPVDVPDLEYVRDPLEVFDLGVRFEHVDQLPAGAVDTGYRQRNTGLWMDPSDPSSIYLVDDTTIERWPLAAAPLCA